MYSKDELVAIYMAGGNVSCILNKMIQDGIDPKALAETVKALDSAKAIREGQTSITDSEVIAIRTYGTLDMMRKDFVKSLTQDKDCATFPLNEVKMQAYCKINEDKTAGTVGAGSQPKPAEKKPVTNNMSPAMAQLLQEQHAKI